MDLYNLTSYYWGYSQYLAFINDTLLNILKYTSFHTCLIIFWKHILDQWICTSYRFLILIDKKSFKMLVPLETAPLVEEYYFIPPPDYFGWSDVLKKKVYCFVCTNLITRMFSTFCCWLLHCLLDKLPVYDFYSFFPSIKTILPLHIGW